MAEDTETLQANLAEARAAFHKLRIGKQTASASYDGKAVTYAKADMPALAAYIRSLETQLGIRPKPAARRLYF